jgi:tetratricopeptide (TPR) repeat protein
MPVPTATLARLYKQALTIKPDYTNACCNWGNSLHKLGRFEEAIEKYSHSLSIKPDNDSALFNMACAYAMMANVQETIRYLDEWRGVDANVSIEKLDKNSDFDGIREDAAFQKYLQKW